LQPASSASAEDLRLVAWDTRVRFAALLVGALEFPERVLVVGRRPYILSPVQVVALAVIASLGRQVLGPRPTGRSQPAFPSVLA